MTGLSQAVAVIGQVWRWWRAGLLDVVWCVRQHVGGRRLVVEALRGRLTAVRLCGKDDVDVWRAASLEELTPDQHKAALSASMFCLRPAEGTVRRSMVIPAAAEGDVEDIVANELDRLTPFSTRSGVYGFRVESIDADVEHRVVEVCVLPRASYGALLATLHGYGLTPVWIVQDGREPVIIVATVQRESDGALGQRTWLYVGVLAVLLAIACYVPIARVNGAMDDVAVQVRELERRVVGLRRQRELDDAQEALVREVLVRREATWLLSDLLRDVSAALPEGGIVEELQVEPERASVFYVGPMVDEFAAGLRRHAGYGDVAIMRRRSGPLEDHEAVEVTLGPGR